MSVSRGDTAVFYLDAGAVTNGGKPCRVVEVFNDPVDSVSIRVEGDPALLYGPVPTGDVSSVSVNLTPVPLVMTPAPYTVVLLASVEDQLDPATFNANIANGDFDPNVEGSLWVVGEKPAVLFTKDTNQDIVNINSQLLACQNAINPTPVALDLNVPRVVGDPGAAFPEAVWAGKVTSQVFTISNGEIQWSDWSGFLSVTLSTSLSVNVANREISISLEKEVSPNVWVSEGVIVIHEFDVFSVPDQICGVLSGIPATFGINYRIVIELITGANTVLSCGCWHVKFELENLER